MNIEQSTIDRLMAEIFHAEPQRDSRSVDYIGAAGDDVFEVRLRRQGLRDVRDAMLQMASYLVTSKRRIYRGIVLISLTRTSQERVLEEWLGAKAVMLPDIARRLYLIAVIDGKPRVEPASPETAAMAEKFLTVVTKVERPEGLRVLEGAAKLWPNAAGARQVSTSWKHLEVEKVLLHRWLLNEGPIQIASLQANVGCSYPTVKHAMRTLAEEKLIQRGIGKSVELTRYPRDRWARLIASSEQVYTPVVFVDVTSDPASPEALLKRLQRLRSGPPVGVAVGGVAAGRYWNRSFDLNGTPRLDLVLHAPARPDQSQSVDLEFVRELDPALKVREGEHAHRSPVLVVHPIHRKESLFQQEPNEPLPWADPVETIIHLNELGLTQQAGELVVLVMQRAQARSLKGLENG